MPASGAPITGRSMSVAAFVGLASGGPVGDPVRVESEAEYAEVFGLAGEWEQAAPAAGAHQRRDPVPGTPARYTATSAAPRHLPHAVGGFFANGGQACWVLRIPDAPADPIAAQASALAALADIDEISIVAAPDLMTLAGTDHELATTLQLGLIDHCESLGDRLAILDPPPALTPEALVAWRDRTGYDSRQAVLYVPWLCTVDPVSSAEIIVPPCGHLAGTWARSDATAGVHKAPSNLSLFAVTGLECPLAADEQDELVLRRVNVIRPAGRRGIRASGARTLSSDPEWRYVNVRRLCIYIEASISAGIQWTVFEPNDELLWERVQARVYDFLKETWRAGMVHGRRPQEAFWVKCDAETNPPEDVECVTVTVAIGIAPVKPGEFLVFRIRLCPVGSS